MIFENKVAIITGGASGIGLATVKKFLELRVKVALLDIDDAKGNEETDKLKLTYGDNITFLHCDVTDEDNFEDCFKKTLEAFGKINIVVNNSGMFNESPKSWSTMMDVNLKGVVNGTLLGIKYMGKHNGGSGGDILATSSVAGLKPRQYFPLYAASKAAVIHFYRSIACEYYESRFNIRFLVIAPGFTKTPLVSNPPLLFPLPKLDMVKLFLCRFTMQTTQSVAESFIYALENGTNGQIIVVANDKPPFVLEVPEYPCDVY